MKNVLYIYIDIDIDILLFVAKDDDASACGFCRF